MCSMSRLVVTHRGKLVAYMVEAVLVKVGSEGRFPRLSRPAGAESWFDKICAVHFDY